MKLLSLSGNGAITKLPAMAVVLALLCLIVIELYHFATGPRPAAPSAAGISTPAPSQNPADIGPLAASHLFGTEDQSTPQYQEAKQDPSLNLTLRGIVANTGGTSSLAIIQAEPGHEETFALGDEVFNKGRLDFVATDHVILAHSNGQLTRLQLPEQDSSGVDSEAFLPQAQPDYIEAEPVVSDLSVAATPPAMPETEPVQETGYTPALSAEPVMEQTTPAETTSPATQEN